jgi:MFS family permease
MTSVAAPAPNETVSGLAADKAMFSTIVWRLMPWLFLAYGVNYVDRINIGFAKLQMAQRLEWGDTVFGIGAGIFFIGYLMFEIPSNLVLDRIGARKTLLRIMFCWGIAESALMFVRTPAQFYVVRFVLGSFEAGFFPGVMLYLTYWFPGARRGRVISKFMIAMPIAGILAGPTSGAVLKFLDGAGGLQGWQWMFLVHGVPASILGVLIFVFLTDRPEQASWLSPEQKQRLRELLEADREQAAPSAHGSPLRVLRDPLVWVFTVTYFLTLGGSYTLAFMLPSIVKSWGIPDPFVVGLCTVIPYVVTVLALVAFGSSSDHFHERRWHFALSILISASGAALILLAQGHVVTQLVGLTAAVPGTIVNAAMLFALATERLPKRDAAAGIAMISCFGNLGSAVAPVITGRIVESTGKPMTSLYFMIAVYLVAVVWLMMRVPARAAAERDDVRLPRGA